MLAASHSTNILQPGKEERTIYDYLLDCIGQEYDTEKVLKTSERGSVFLLRHKKSGKRFIFRKYTGNCDVYRKLLGVDCPNLPQIMEVAEKDGQAAILEEYIPGDSLAFLLEGDLFTQKETRRIALQLCRGLWVLHHFGAVHRDIKPENVILRGNTAVLIDFDASRIFKASSDSDTQVLGTTGYAAPEQYGIGQTDGRADIYSLGVLMNVLCTGKHPSVQLAPGKLGKIIQKCTMISPQSRYQDITALMEAL